MRGGDPSRQRGEEPRPPVNGGQNIEVLSPGVLRQSLAVAETVQRYSIL